MSGARPKDKPKSSQEQQQSVTQTETVTKEEAAEAEAAKEPAEKLKLKEKDKNAKKVVWTEETVDNEHLGRKKSKCCCVYVKPRTFKPGSDQTSSEDESSGDECDHCPGHHGKDLKKKE